MASPFEGDPMEFNIERVAELARLNLKPEEKEKLEKDLGAILAYVQKLDALGTKEVEPLSHVLDMANVFRADEVAPSNAALKALEHAPQTEGHFFKVPKIVQR
jgi:aspartyl-tRNA(Asn)/glutamyl-tRNA(Gln) amidotransferase subunit C